MAIAKTFAAKLAFVGFVPADRVIAGPPGVVLAVHIETRNQTEWCWAAVAVGIATAYQDTDSSRWGKQCLVVTRMMKPLECCEAGDYSDCDRSYFLDLALEDHYDPLPIPPGDEFEFDFVKDRTDAGYPLAIRLGVKGDDAGHFVVIAGYREVNGVRQLWIADPANGSRYPVDFDELKKPDPKKRYWTHTFRTKGLTPVPQEA